MNSITSRQRAMIIRLARQGATLKKIARAAGVCRNTVARVRRNAGLLPTHRHLDADLTERALEMLRAGTGYTAVAKKLRVPRREVKALQLEHKLRAKMDRRPDPRGDLAGFKRALRNGEGHVKALARRFHIDEERGLRIAHRELGTPHFKRGRNKIPLQHADDWPRGIDAAENRRLTN